MPRSTSASKWLFLCLLVATRALALPSFGETKQGLARSEWRLFDRRGEVIQELRADWRVRQLGWTALSEISPALRQAVILSEDQRFYRHHGADWLALSRALAERVLGKFVHRAPRGASTISMQVAALIDPSLRPRRGRRDWLQKFFQIQGGRELERSWSKDQILEAYLNLIFFRGELRGVASAARALFGKTPSGLDSSEAMILAALIRGPEAAPLRVQARACQLAARAGHSEWCPTIAAEIGAAGLKPRPFPPAVALAPHAARLLAKEGQDHSTLDRRVQARVREILRRHVLQLHDRNLQDAAALVVDNASGEVIAYVGSVGDLSSAGEVDGIRARRQAGSTLKPFLYSLALEKRYLTASSRLDDSPADIALGAGAVYRPRDFDHEFHGPDVTLRQALGSSLNVPAVRTLQLVGVQNLVERLRALGFGELRSEEFYGPSLALGTADVTLWELTNAFRTLANRGLFSELTLSPRPAREPKPVIAPEATFLVQDILSDRESRQLTFGLDTPLALPFWAAAKTGTSKDMRDNWCVGFSSRYTVGVWAGNFSGAPMWNVSGISGAAPAWAEIMEALHRPGRDVAPKPPAGVTRFAGEWYLRGTEPEPTLRLTSAAPQRPRRITYPVEGLIVARDPDIPPDRQRVFFEADYPDARLSWVLNNERLGDASRNYPWPPGKAGQYELKLMDGKGAVVDVVHFSIRGAATSAGR